MIPQAEYLSADKHKAAADPEPKQEGRGASSFQFKDKRPQTIAQRALVGQMQTRRAARKEKSLQENAAQPTLQETSAEQSASQLTPSLPTGQVIQRYVVRNGYHVSNNGTMAVKNVVNNKELYATQARIAHAEAILRRQTNGISLAEGPVTDFGDPDVTTLRRVDVTVAADDNARNEVQADYKPVAGVGGRVELPSECERGAVAILGSLITNEKQVGNIYNARVQSHENDRIANIIARSPAGAVQKQTWYDEWVRLTGLVSDSVTAYKRFEAHQTVANGLIDPIRAEVNQGNAALGTTVADLHIVSDGLVYSPVASFNNAKVTMGRMLKDLDGRVDELEHEIMASADAGGHGVIQQNLLDQRDVRDRIINLYAAHQFPKALIRHALQLTGKSGQLNKYFANNAATPNDFANNLNFRTAARMRTFLEEVVAALQVNIANLVTQRRAAFGNVGNQNEAVDPAIGQAYGIIGGGFQGTDFGRWNWHWAGVIMKSDYDNVTMEAHAMHKQGAETHNYRWDFKMYGRPRPDRINVGKTFHDRQKGDGFGSTPVTVLGQAHAPQQTVPDFAGFRIDNLAPGEVHDALRDAHDLRQALGPLAVLGSADQMVSDYNAGIADIQLLFANLPGGFVNDKLRAHHTLFLDNMIALKSGIDDGPTQLAARTAASDAAAAMRVTLQALTAQLLELLRARKTGRV